MYFCAAMKQTLKHIRIMFLLLASLVVLVSQGMPQNVVKKKRTHVQASQFVGYAMPAELEEEDIEENTSNFFRLISVPISGGHYSLSEVGSKQRQDGSEKSLFLVGSKRLSLLCVLRI